MGTLIDTSVLIAAERGDVNLEALLALHGQDEIAISAITASELLHGVHPLKGAVRRAQAGLLVDRLIALMPAIPVDLDVARVHAALSAELSGRGRDRRSFPRIRGLALQVW